MGVSDVGTRKKVGGSLHPISSLIHSFRIELARKRLWDEKTIELHKVESGPQMPCECNWLNAMFRELWPHLSTTVAGNKN
jgi:hypothetical protein